MCKANDEQQYDSDNQEEREDKAICIGVVLDPMTGVNSTILRGCEFGEKAVEAKLRQHRDAPCPRLEGDIHRHGNERRSQPLHR